MNTYFLKIHVALFCSIFLLQNRLLAQSVDNVRPIFSIDEQNWYPIDSNMNQFTNLRIYGHRDQEHSTTSAPDQALQIHIGKDKRCIAEFQQATRDTFPNEEIVEKQVHENDYLSIHSNTIMNPESSDIPKMVIVTAVFDVVSEIITVQYILQPKCKKCMEFKDKWINRLKKMELSEDASRIVLDNENSIPLHTYNPNLYEISAKEGGHLTWVSEFLATNCTWIVSAGGAAIFYVGKFLASAMGWYTCPKYPGAPCCCLKNGVCPPNAS